MFPTSVNAIVFLIWLILGIVFIWWSGQKVVPKLMANPALNKTQIPSLSLAFGLLWMPFLMFYVFADKRNFDVIGVAIALGLIVASIGIFVPHIFAIGKDKRWDAIPKWTKFFSKLFMIGGLCITGGGIARLLFQDAIANNKWGTYAVNLAVFTVSILLIWWKTRNVKSLDAGVIEGYKKYNLIWIWILIGAVVFIVAFPFVAAFFTR
ncbi:MAG TPA: hypothetical protein VJL57_03690 [Candidatus Paceibacterota bacterium]